MGSNDPRDSTYLPGMQASSRILEGVPNSEHRALEGFRPVARALPPHAPF